MRRVERAAVEADAQAGRMGRKLNQDRAALLPRPCGEGGLGRRPSRVGVEGVERVGEHLARVEATKLDTVQVEPGPPTPTPAPPRKGEGNASPPHGRVWPAPRTRSLKEV